MGHERWFYVIVLWSGVIDVQPKLITMMGGNFTLFTEKLPFFLAGLR